MLNTYFGEVTDDEFVDVKYNIYEIARRAFYNQKC